MKPLCLPSTTYVKLHNPWLLLLLSLSLSACQLTYMTDSAYNQLKLLSARQPIDKVLANPDLDSETKHKLLLAQQAREFAETHLNLKPTKNYTSYVELGRPYVSYIVQAAPVYELKHYLWRFPIVGAVPYKGFFSKDKALREAARFDPEKYDTYVRGVSAYSTLGWFRDPILSSMLSYDDDDLVNLIIHETVHATIYIKNHADFNERLATFVGDIGTEYFYLKQEGEDSSTLKHIQDKNHDARLFSDFISSELNSLRTWYHDKSETLTPELKSQRLALIQENFQNKISSQLKTQRFSYFTNLKLNNAMLLSFETYYMDLSDFKEVFVFLNKDFAKLIEFCKELEKASDPELKLKEFVASFKGSDETL